MSKNTGGPALPESGARVMAAGGEGMTLRDYFAAKAMQSFLAIIETYPDQPWREGLAMDAYRMADAMLKEREK